MAITTLTGTGNNTPVWREGDGNVLLVNRDLINHIIIGPDSGIGSGSASNINTYSIIDPLGSIAVDDSQDWYAGVLEASGSANLDVIPGGSYWAPSPAQVAAQINALGLMKDTTGQAINTTAGGTTTAVNNVPTGISTTGVPLLNRANNLNNTSGTIVNSGGGTASFGPFTISQIGYEIFWSVVNTVTGDLNPFLIIEMTWSDSASGQTVSQEFWTLSAGMLGSGGQKYFGTGPSKGDTLNITVVNQGTQNMSIAMALNQHSRIYQRDDWRTVSPAVGVFGFTNPNSNPPGNILAYTNTTIGAGSSITRIMPLYAGLVSFSISPSVANTFQFTLHSQDNITTVGASSAIYFNNVTGTGGANFGVALPRAICTYSLLNNGSASATWNVSCTIQEQPQ